MDFFTKKYPKQATAAMVVVLVVLVALKLSGGTIDPTYDDLRVVVPTITAVVAVPLIAWFYGTQPVRRRM